MIRAARRSSAAASRRRPSARAAAWAAVIGLPLAAPALAVGWPPPPEPPVPAASGSTGPGLAIVGATVHVGDGATVLHGATVVVRDGLIASVGAGAPPAGLAVLDGRGRHLTPGLVATDTVLGLVEVAAVRATRDDTEVGQVNPHVRAVAAVNPDGEQLGVAVAGGVLNAVVTPRGGAVSGLGAVIRLRGWTREDMSLRDAAALRVTWPNMRLDRAPKAKPSLEEQERLRDERLRALDNLIHEARAFHASSAERASGSLPPGVREPRLAALGPVLTGEVPVLVEADGLTEMRAAIAWAQKHGLRLVLTGGRDAWRMAREIAEAGVPVIVTPVRALPARRDEPYDAAFRNPVVLRDAGVALCFTVGTESFGAAHVRNLADEAAMAIPWGLDPEAALRAITLEPARVFGVHQLIGSVEAGKRADLVLWDGPPLEITSSPATLVLGGEILPADDRHSRIYRKYAARPTPGG